MIGFVSSLLGFTGEVVAKATVLAAIAIVARARGYRLIKVPQSERVTRG